MKLPKFVDKQYTYWGYETSSIDFVSSTEVKKSLKWIYYTEAKVDVTKEIEQRAQWSAPAWAACCALCSISCVTSTLASV